MRIGIISIAHESNTFLPDLTTPELWHADIVLSGDDVRSHFLGSSHEIGGFLEGLAINSAEAVPIFAARANPSGTITREAEVMLIESMLEALGAAGRLDGLLVAPHGAAVGEIHRDFDGWWLGLLRQRVGLEVPIVATLDPHCNLSQAMVDSLNAILSYRTNPHIDQLDRGLRAAELIVRHVRGEVRLVTAAAFPRAQMNIGCQCTEEEPCLSLVREMDDMLGHADVLTNSLNLGFPYADVEEMGTSFTVTTDGDRALAQRLADAMAERFMGAKDRFQPRLISIAEALDAVVSLGPNAGTSCLLDQGDNAGGGSPADGTLITQALVARQLGPAIVALYDPQVAEAAHTAGIGASLQLAVGGKTDDRHGPPLAGRFTVLALTDGRFRENGVTHWNKQDWDMGPTAVLQANGSDLTIMATSLRTPPYSIGQLTHAGIDPAAYRVIVLKGVNAPLAAYRQVASRFIRVNTPGITTVDMRLLSFSRRRRPLHPFEPLT